MSDLITLHILYQSLGDTNDQKQSTYRELFRYELKPDEIDQIRKATNGNFGLDHRFARLIISSADQIEKIFKS